jgi:ABC-type polysaccharide/polyol phosphate transport system ATPase subunit
MSDAIVFNHVSKRYELAIDRPILAKRFFLPSVTRDIIALDDVSFRIRKGETVGIIGANGSGKSTILKLIAKIITPTKGTVTVNGRVASLIELGAGFHPDLSGRENIYLNGTIMGLEKKQIGERYKSIVDFADIGDFINQPVRTYSSGMVIRLGFSVAIHLDPEILLIDEVLAVGDEEYQKKCIDKTLHSHNENKTIVLVSHNLHLIRNVCQRVMLIDDSKMCLFSDPETAISKYLDIVNDKISSHQENEAQNNPVRVRTTKSRGVNAKIILQDIKLFDGHNVEKRIFFYGDCLSIRIYFQTQRNIDYAVFGILIRDETHQIVFGTNTELDNFIVNPSRKKYISYTIPLLPFQAGSYYLDVTVRGRYESDIYDYIAGKHIIYVKQKKSLRLGSIDLLGKWSIHS